MKKADQVLVTCPPMQRSIDRYQDLFRDRGIQAVCPQMTQVLSEDELMTLLPQYDGWIIGDDPATKRVFHAGVNGRLRAAVKWGVGVDNVDFEGATTAGLNVSNTPGMFGDEVADIAIGYVVGLARQTFLINQGVHAGDWPKPVGISLSGKTAAVVGFGDIGKATARRLLACRMNVIVYDPMAPACGELDCQVQRMAWPEQIDKADFIVLCCALNDATRQMVNVDLLGRCKQGVRIVNVSRGSLIDERALVDALQSGVVHSAALEVFEKEPLPANSPLRAYKNCLFGSHNASNTQEAVDRTSHKAIELLAAQFDVGASVS